MLKYCIFEKGTVFHQNSICFDGHSGLDPESSISELDFRWSLP